MDLISARRKGLSDRDKHKYHDQTVISLGGKLAAIDSDIAPLVETLEAGDGVTVTNWQDHHGSMGRLLLEGPRAFEFLVAMAQLGREQGCDRFSVELGEKLAINWLERTFTLTLETAKQVARRSRP